MMAEDVFESCSVEMNEDDELRLAAAEEESLPGKVKTMEALKLDSELLEELKRLVQD